MNHNIFYGITAFLILRLVSILIRALQCRMLHPSSAVLGSKMVKHFHRKYETGFQPLAKTAEVFAKSKH
jgi:hypothetical protein